METSSLQDILERLQSDSAPSNKQGIDALGDWLKDARNMATAEASSDIYHYLVRSLMQFMRRQIGTLAKPGGKRVAFQLEGASYLQQVVRLACDAGGGRRSGQPKLARIQRKLWEHVEEVLRCEAVAVRQPATLPYYCRIARDLAEHASLGYLNELRGELFRRLVRHLMQVASPGAQGAALEAAAQLFRHADVDPSAEVSWACDRAVVLLPCGVQPVAVCLAAACLRCPLAFRDWVLVDGHADALAEAMVTKWSLKTSEGLDLVLRLAIGFGAPLQHRHAANLLIKTVDTLESLARAEPSTSDVLVARLADLLAVLLLHVEPTLEAACKRVCAQLEQRCLPWALCVVRLCEGQAATLFGERHSGDIGRVDGLMAIFDALSTLSAMPVSRLTAPEFSAVRYALTAVISARAWARLWPSGTRLPTWPVPLSILCGEGTAMSLLSPDVIALLPSLVCEFTPEWKSRMQKLAEQVLGIAVLGQLAPRGIHKLMGVILLAAHPETVESTVRQLLAQQAGSGAASSPKPMNASMCRCFLAAMRWHQTDAATQKALWRSMSREPADSKACFLHLCANGGRWTLPLSRQSQAVIQNDEDDDDVMCAHVPLVADADDGFADFGMERFEATRCPSSSSTSPLPERSPGAMATHWYNSRHSKLLKQLEERAVDAALDRNAANVNGGSISSIMDDLRVHHAVETAAFRVRSGSWHLGHADIVTPPPRAFGLQHVRATPAGSNACNAAVDQFVQQAEDFLSTCKIGDGKGSPDEGAAAESRDPGEICRKAIDLLNTMDLVLRLPRAPSSKWPFVFRDCLANMFGLAHTCVAGRAEGCMQYVNPMLQGLLRLLNSEWAALPGQAAGSDGDHLLDAPEVVQNALRFSTAVCESWEKPLHAAGLGQAQTGSGSGIGKNASDLFETRSSVRAATAVRPESFVITRSLSLRLMLALARRWPRGEIAGDGLSVETEFRQLLQRAIRTEANSVLRLMSLELLASGGCFAASTLEICVQAWCSAADPVVLQDVEDALLFALRMTGLSWRRDSKLREVLKNLWSPTSKGESRLLSLLKKWQSEPQHLLGSRGKILFAVLCTRTLQVFRDVQNMASVTALVTDCLSSTVFDLMLKDESNEVRIALGAECTKPFLELFDDTQILPEFEDAWAPLRGVDGTAAVPPSSAEVALMQIMVAISTFSNYASRIVPELCVLRAQLRPLVRHALSALDEELLGKRGEAGTSRLALALRARVFHAHLRSGVKLTDLALSDLALQLPPRAPRGPLGRHVAAAVVALALSENLSQLPDLALACGYPSASNPEFEALIFVPFAGSVLPVRRSLEGLHTRYAKGRAMALCKQEAPRILAFSLQLPFLTASLPNPIDGHGIMTAFTELSPQSPWSDFKGFVSKHFHFLLSKLDRILGAWSRWSPAVAVDLLRSFADWVGPLRGARLRLLLPALYRHGMAMPFAQREKLCNVIEFVVGSSADALCRLVLHQDESLRELLGSVERECAHQPGRLDVTSGKKCPPLVALVEVLRGLRRASSSGGASARDGRGAEWFRLQVDAMLPRLHTDAQHVLQAALDENASVAGGGRPAKRRRQTEVHESISSALRPLEPPEPRLAWGPLPAPDLGALAHCLADACGDGAVASKGAIRSDGVALSRVLRLLARPLVVAQIRRDRNLARMLAQGLSSISPSLILQLGDEDDDDVLEGALPRLGQRDSQQPPNSHAAQGIDELLCGGALLGASMLQVHSSERVRHFALTALQQLARQQGVFADASKLLHEILDPQHLCLEDLSEIQPAEAPPQPKSSSVATGDVAWDFFGDSCDVNRTFSVWVRALCSKMMALGSKAWDPSLAEMLLSCAPLAQSVDWFAERMLVLSILKAAVHRRSARHIAKAISTLLSKELLESGQAQCIIRALHYVRRYQTAKRRRAVPYFPNDKDDPFWAALDLLVVSDCASRVGCARDSLLYLELHLSRSHPDLPIDQTLLKSGSQRVGIDELFRKPSKEVQLLQNLASQLPEDELVYGISQWCHTSSRLVRAELGHDHLFQLHLHSNLLEAQLHSHGESCSTLATAQAGLDSALSRLGLHTVAGISPAEVSSTSTWERRMEGLWRLRQWNWGGDGNMFTASGDVGSASTSMVSPGPSHSGGIGSPAFHGKLHGALAGIAKVYTNVRSGSTPGSAVIPTDLGPAETAVAPLDGLVAEVAASLHARSLEQLKVGAIQLQMLGSVFNIMDASRDPSRGSGSAIGTVGARWASMATGPPMSAPDFHLVEPLSALRATALGIAAPSLVELRFLTTLATQAREAMQVHRALGLLEQAHRVSNGVPRSDLLRLHWEQARCFWDLKQQHECLSIARAVAAECRSMPAPRPGAANGNAIAEQAWMSRALSDTGLWLSQSRMEGPDIVRSEFLNPAVSMAPLDAKPRRQLAEFLDARLSEELARQNSLDHSMTFQTHARVQRDLAAQRAALQALERGGGASNPQAREAEMKNLRDHIRQLERTCEQDSQQQRQAKERLKNLAVLCLQEMGRCLMESNMAGSAGGHAEGESQSQSLTSVACRFVSIWFDHSREYPETTTTVKEVMPKLAIAQLSPFLYQLASRLGTQDTFFRATLEELLIRLVPKAAHNLWPLLLIKNGDVVPKDMRGVEKFVPDKEKIDAAKRILEKLRRQQAMRQRLEATEAVSNFYMRIALHAVDKRNRDVKIPVASIEGYRQVLQALKHVPVPTADPSPEPGQVSPCIAAFDECFSIAKQGLSAPKIICLTDTSGRRHTQIAKGHDDLRQDAVMQQLFRLLNEILSENPQSRRADLRMRTFQVVPLSPVTGLMECVDAVTLSEVLTGNSNPAEGAHARYRPHDWSHTHCRQRLSEARNAYNAGDTGALERAYNEVCTKFKPVMHLVFLELFPSPQVWHKARQLYSRSTAVSSMVGYIVGIGDRHPNNILFDRRTGELVHIDFGITFDAGKLLKVPELTPCRLTRDVVDGLGCLGTCGLFRHSCETTLGVLRDASALVNSVVEVFVHDPVYNWSLAPRKSDQPGSRQGAAEVGASVEVDGNEMARRALLTVKSKLRGEQGVGTVALGVPAHVGWVIREAMDPSNLARMYFGWSQWL